MHACEPAITGRPGIVLPEPGYHEKLRALTRRFGTLLVIDETHTICGGPWGYTAAHNLEPDILTLGKPIAGGVPAAVYGISQEVANKAYGLEKPLPYGLGGTLSGNALAVAAMRATLEHVMTKEAYNKMIPLPLHVCRVDENVTFIYLLRNNYYVRFFLCW